MKKKFNTLLQRERLVKDAEFNRLYAEYLDSKAQVGKAKDTHRSAKDAFREASQKPTQDKHVLPELLAILRKEKFMARHLREVFRLNKIRLQRWIDHYLHQVVEKQENETVKVKRHKLEKKSEAQQSELKADSNGLLKRWRKKADQTPVVTADKESAKPEPGKKSARKTEKKGVQTAETEKKPAVSRRKKTDAASSNGEHKPPPSKRRTDAAPPK